MNIFIVTLPFLLMLALSYAVTSRARLLSLEFAYWLISYQFIFIGALGVGLIQSHIGCPMPLEECYVENYPPLLDIFKFMLETCLIAWILGSAATSALNLWRIRKRAHPQGHHPDG